MTGLRTLEKRVMEQMSTCSGRQRMEGNGPEGESVERNKGHWDRSHCGRKSGRREMGPHR